MVSCLLTTLFFSALFSLIIVFKWLLSNKLIFIVIVIVISLRSVALHAFVTSRFRLAQVVFNCSIMYLLVVYSCRCFTVGFVPVAVTLSTIAITHLYIISIQIAIMSIVKPCLHITMK